MLIIKNMVDENFSIEYKWIAHNRHNQPDLSEIISEIWDVDKWDMIDYLKHILNSSFVDAHPNWKKLKQTLGA